MKEDTPQREFALRELFNALRWFVRAGCPWRMLPNDLPPWTAVQQQALRWMRAGCFEAMAHDLRAVVRLLQERAAEPSAVILDGRTLQSSPESGGRAGYDGYKRKKGSKVHVAVDTLGNLLAVAVTPASEQERAQLAALAEAVQAATGQSVEHAWVDQGYTGKETAAAAAAHGIRLEVVKLPAAKRGLSCCPAGGWWNAPLPGWPDSGGFPGTTNDFPPPLPACTGSRFPACCATCSPSTHKVNDKL